MIDYKLLSQKREEIKQEVLDKLKTSNRIGVVEYTGFGKSWLMTSLCKELDGRKVVIEPTNILKFGIESRLDENCNTDTILYGFISRGSKSVLDTMFKNVKYLFMDECHKTFSKRFKQKLDYIIKNYPDIKIVGFTATPERTDGINVINEFFKEKVSELTLIDALENNFVDNITYITAYADPKSALEGTSLGNLKRIQLENVYRIPEIFKRRIDRKEYLDDKNFKILLFVGRLDYIDDMSINMTKWLNEAFPDKKVNTYLLKSRVDKYKSNEIIRNFESNYNINEIDLLISVNKLSEGIHINNVRCSMFFRKTASNIVFNQQLGRITHSEKPIAFDFVENFHNIRSIMNDLDNIKAFQNGEYNKKTTKEYNYEEPITNKIIVIDESKEIREIVCPHPRTLKQLSNEDKQWIINNSKNYTRPQIVELFKDKYEKSVVLYFINTNHLETVSLYCYMPTKEEALAHNKLLKDHAKEIENMTIEEIKEKFFKNKSYTRTALSKLLNKNNLYYKGGQGFSEKEKQFIKDNYTDNKSIYEIADKLHRSHTTIRRYLKKNFGYQTQDEKNLIIKNIIKNNITLTRPKIKEIILKESGLKVSTNKLYKFIKEIIEEYKVLEGDNFDPEKYKLDFGTKDRNNKIINFMVSNPNITQKEVAEKFGVSIHVIRNIKRENKIIKTS